MACLEVKLTRLGSQLSASYSRIGGLKVAIEDAVRDGHLIARYGIVCAVEAVNDYLRVSPAEVQWITDDIGVFYDVEANVKWVVETN